MVSTKEDLNLLSDWVTPACAARAVRAMDETMPLETHSEHIARSKQAGVTQSDITAFNFKALQDDIGYSLNPKSEIQNPKSELPVFFPVQYFYGAELPAHGAHVTVRGSAAVPQKPCALGVKGRTDLAFPVHLFPAP